VLDTAVVSPIYNGALRVLPGRSRTQSSADHYLISHRGMLGTSKPTHYSVLLDENDFSADDLQTTIYYQVSFWPRRMSIPNPDPRPQCYLHQRASRSVSIASPAYFAHLVCTRGRDQCVRP
jgi:eukaryotic translation initiation factor 2C